MEKSGEETTSFFKGVGKNLKKFRNMSGYTQDQVARLMNKNHYTEYGNLENGKARLNILDAVKLAQIYETSVDSLIEGGFGSDAPSSKPKTKVSITLELDGNEITLMKQLTMLKEVHNSLK